MNIPSRHRTGKNNINNLLLAAKEEAEQNLNQLRSIMDSMSEGLFVFDHRGNILLANKAMLALSGMESVPLEHFRQYASKIEVRDGKGARVQSDDLPIARALRGELVQNIEYHIYRLDTGKNYTALYNVSLVKDKNDQIRLAVMTVQDISERTRADQALRESEELFRTSFENANMGVALVSLKGEFLRSNVKLAEILGYSIEELQKLTFNDITHPEDKQIGGDMLKRMVLGEIDKTTFEKRYIHKTGKIVWASISPGIIRKNSGEPNYFVSYIQDISDHKQSQEEIRQRLVELEVLHEVAIAGTEATGLGEFVQRSIAAGKRLYPSDFGIGLVDESTGRVCFPNYIKSGNHPAPDMPLGLGVTGQVAKRGMAIRLENTSTDPNYVAVDPNIQSELCVPISAGGKVIGVVNVESNDVSAFGAADERLLNGLAGELGTALEKIRLYHKTEQQVERLTALRTIDQSILTSSNLDMTLDILLEKITGLLHVDAANFFLYDPKQKILSGEASRGISTSLTLDITLKLGESHAGKVGLQQVMEFIPDLRVVDDDMTKKIKENGETFVSYLATPLLAKGKLKGVLELFHRTRLEPTPDWIYFLECLVGQAVIAIENSQLFLEQQQLNQRLIKSYDETLDGWSRAMDLRDHETEGHSQRVADLSLKLAKRLNIPEEQLDDLHRGAQLHDIGKMGIPDNILTKPGALTEAEWDIMRQHPIFALDFLQSIIFLQHALDIPYCHHEKWDGSGYPQGLRGKEIPYFARIFAVIDVYDALTSNRPYRLAWTKQAALDYIKEQSGKHFDPHITDEFILLMGEDR